MSRSKSRRVGMSLHGYHPIVVDASLLTTEDRREECDAFRRRSHQNTPFGFSPMVSPEPSEEPAAPQAFDSNSEADYEEWTAEEEDRCIAEASAATLQAQTLFAREKYNRGQAVWYGDGLPTDHVA